jgi:hypothetical protein
MEFSWFFKFEDVATLTTECPWRIITRVGISLASPDNGQSFGRQTAIDAQAEAERLVLGKSIHRAIVRDDTGDLVLDFWGRLLVGGIEHVGWFRGLASQPASGSDPDLRFRGKAAGGLGPWFRMERRQPGEPLNCLHFP